MKEIPKIGRPQRIKSAKQLEELINNYIESCYVMVKNKDGTEYYKNIKPVIMRGFCVYINIAYETLCRWDEERIELREPIKKLREYCHAFAEQKLFSHDSPTVGIIFNLKNNWGWKDKTEVRVEGTEIQFKFEDDDGEDSNV